MQNAEKTAKKCAHGGMMKVENNKIIECTESELFIFWLKRWSDVFDFYSYKEQCKKNGVKIIKDGDD